jgi:DNA repair protein RadC
MSHLLRRVIIGGDAVALSMAKVPVHERPRERLLARGIAALSERELLALVLRHGRRGESALDLASALLADYGSLAAIAAALPEELARHPGIGNTKAAALLAAFQLGRVSTRGSNEGVRLTEAADIAQMAQRELARVRRERVLVLVCDAANRLRRTESVSLGSVDRSPVPVREVLNCVLRHDGRSFAIAHNHPSGDPTPSDADVRATEALAVASKTVGLRFLDHVVVTDESWSVVERRN